jgi:hypothetical protein
VENKLAVRDKTKTPKKLGKSFEEGVGGREKVIETIAMATPDPKRRHLLSMLADPSRKNDSLARMCQDAGIAQTEILEIFRETAMARSFVLSQEILAEKVEAVVEDVSEKAVDREEACVCTANGRLEPDAKCDKCRGTGIVLKRGSLPHAEMIFEAVGLLKRGGGVNVAVQQNVKVGERRSYFDTFVKGTDELAYAVEGELVRNGETKVVTSGDPEGSGTTVQPKV